MSHNVLKKNRSVISADASSGARLYQPICSGSAGNNAAMVFLFGSSLLFHLKQNIPTRIRNQIIFLSNFGYIHQVMKLFSTINHFSHRINQLSHTIDQLSSTINHFSDTFIHLSSWIKLFPSKSSRKSINQTVRLIFHPVLI